MIVGRVAVQNPKAWATVGTIAAASGLVLGTTGVVLFGIPALAIGGFLTAWGNPMFQILPPKKVR